MLLIIVLTASGCLSKNDIPKDQAPPRAAFERTDPKAVGEAFVRAQANNDRNTMQQLMTPELKQSFYEKKLYLFDSEDLKDKKVILNNISIKEERKDDNSALYNIDYELNLKENNLNNTRQIMDLIFVTKDKTSGKWFVSTYQHVLLQ